MALSLDPEKLKRYKDIAFFIAKHINNKDFKLNSLSAEQAAIQEDESSAISGNPVQFVKDLEDLGPTFIKLGQLLSTRPDFLPMPYIKALNKLQDKVEPISFEEVEKIVQEELGIRISKAFQEFSSKPMASASLGQVHKAVLRDGRTVAVKVQRPNIRPQAIKDIEALEEITETVDKHTEIGKTYSFSDIMEQFKKTLFAELDYRKEANNLKKLHENLREYKDIVIPLPVEDYTTSKILTMEYVQGIKITSINPVVKVEVDGKRLASELFRAYLDQFLVDGFFHADPHPGNVFITNERKIALIDLGMVAYIDPQMRESLLRLLLYVSEGKGIETAKLSIKIGKKLGHYDEEGFIRYVTDFVTKYKDANLEDVQVGSVVIELTQIGAQFGIRIPPQFTIIGKTLLNLDIIGTTLDPEFNPNNVIQEHANSILTKQTYNSLTPGNILTSLLEANEFIQKLPGRLNDFLDKASNNELAIKIDAIDEHRIVENMQKIANRITMGLVLAALIIGAALMMNSGGTFKILGYPGLAMIMFLLAATFGFVLVINIFLKDEWKRKKKT